MTRRQAQVRWVVVHLADAILVVLVLAFVWLLVGTTA